LRKEISSLKGKEAQLKELIKQKEAATVETIRTWLTWLGLIVSVGSVVVICVSIYYQFSMLKKLGVFCSIVGIGLLVSAKLLPYLDMATTGIAVLAVFSLLGLAVYYGVKYVLKLNKTITSVYAFGDDAYDKLTQLVENIKSSSVKAFASESDKTEYIHNMIKLAEGLDVELSDLKSSHRDDQVKAGVFKNIQEARRAINTKPTN
jgi:uncharacterized membrane protein YgaE (UPF0421/DUF939 family)